MIRKTLGVAAAILGALALVAGSPYRTRHAVAEVSPVELAEWIRDRKPELRVIDPRPAAEFDDYHLPRAENVVAPSSAAFKPTETIVLVAGDGQGGDGQGIDHQVYVLRGGVRGWIDEVMNPTITANASPAERAAYQRASIVSRYFGGVPRVVDKPQAKSSDTAAAVKAVRRRGC
jgi:rhodanese-related sulfurtransferase